VQCDAPGGAPQKALAYFLISLRDLLLHVMVCTFSYILSFVHGPCSAKLIGRKHAATCHRA
jgi:hypothetical protein